MSRAWPGAAELGNQTWQDFWELLVEVRIWLLFWKRKGRFFHWGISFSIPGVPERLCSITHSWCVPGRSPAN